jgi:hypothetical protein
MVATEATEVLVAVVGKLESAVAVVQAATVVMEATAVRHKVGAYRSAAAQSFCLV